MYVCFYMKEVDLASLHVFEKHVIYVSLGALGYFACYCKHVHVQVLNVCVFMHRRFACINSCEIFALCRSLW